jgi:hypothetical protein
MSDAAEPNQNAAAEAGLSPELEAARSRCLPLSAELKLAQARLAMAEQDRDTWRQLALTSERRHGEALAELERLRGRGGIG